MKNIAIIGLSPNQEKPSYFVSKYLQDLSYTIYPIYPKEDFILNEKVYRNLREIPSEIDTVVMFRKASYANEIFEDLLAKNVKNFWMQLGIINDEIMQKCKKFGINCVQDRCIKIELDKKVNHD
ncbi:MULTISPECIES: CoA-binding protein [Campylobacter]|uniref:CoA-binding protein n=1 Tax=Campylobacter TaxID=194 RepID=UPI001C73A4F6|nr:MULTISPECIES: CoA-binding protein [Campylobacter]MBX1935324.1 CoA-binding protein [Campylobacter lari]MCV3355946.1 CoA-binding protein [Campylobacter sp. RKI_CA19_01122]MCV3382462.1 CoA-binding protein [Campylobacter sp. IFREMER_LSEM_CL292]MCV3392948.1 CoA-binding protein [Campylobacter sp. IFREMER_LSEM_CL908]MCV3424061.1 CoA-binding protein [Campylobacter sp. IFREMER_LSEM_CL1085]